MNPSAHRERVAVPDPSRRGIILIEPGSAAPGPLLSGLAKHGVGIVLVGSASAVMVELSKRSAVAVVVVEPNRQPMVAELVTAIRRYYPRIGCWEFHCGARPMLTRFNGLLPPPPQAAPAVPGATAADPVRIGPRPGDGTGSAQGTRPTPTLPVPGDEGPLISEQEMKMLLGPVGQDADEPSREG